MHHTTHYYLAQARVADLRWQAVSGGLQQVERVAIAEAPANHSLSNACEASSRSVRRGQHAVDNLPT